MGAAEGGVWRTAGHDGFAGIRSQATRISGNCAVWCRHRSVGGAGTRRRGLLPVFAFLVLLVAAAGTARADDFELLVSNAKESGTVPVLITGWHAITGDEPYLTQPDESRPGALMAITGDEFVKNMQKASSKATVVRRYENFPVLAMSVDTTALRAAKAENANVEVWDDPVLEPSLTRSVPMVGAPAAWNKGFDGAGTAIVIVDTGVDTDHPFLKGRVALEICFADRCPNGKTAMVGDGAARPVGAHGTHVAGIAAGSSDSGDVAGVAPKAMVIAIRAFNENGKANSNSILAALDAVLTLAREKPGLIGAVNMSLGANRSRGGRCHVRPFDIASRLLNEAGIPVIVASGNEGSRSAVGFPACIGGFISVGAVDKAGRIAKFSNSGPELDVLAPGVDIWSAVSRDPAKGIDRRGYASLPGTSMAAPHVAAAMAILKRAAPDRSVEDLLSALKAAGRPIRDSRNGHVAPLIDIEKAVAMVTPGGEPPRRPRLDAAPPPPIPDPEPPTPPKRRVRAEPKPTPKPEPRLEPTPPTKGTEEDQWKSITGD